MKIFSKWFSAKKPQKAKKVFIVEDNSSYAKFLKNFLQSRFPEITEFRLFPVGETCLMEMDSEPDLVIVDYFLNSKYSDAETGAETIRQIREKNSKCAIILLSAQDISDFLSKVSKDYTCIFIKKDEHAFHKVEAVMKKLRARPFMVSTDLLSSVLSISTIKKGFNKLQSRTLSLFD
jgi:DNA-binding NarL/FixJ family response regulator